MFLPELLEQVFPLLVECGLDLLCECELCFLNVCFYYLSCCSRSSPCWLKVVAASSRLFCCSLNVRICFIWCKVLSGVSLLFLPELLEQVLPLLVKSGSGLLTAVLLLVTARDQLLQHLH